MKKNILLTVLLSFIIFGCQKKGLKPNFEIQYPENYNYRNVNEMNRQNPLIEPGKYYDIYDVQEVASFLDTATYHYAEISLIGDFEENTKADLLQELLKSNLEIINSKDTIINGIDCRKTYFSGEDFNSLLDTTVTEITVSYIFTTENYYFCLSCKTMQDTFDEFYPDFQTTAESFKLK